MIFKLLTGLGGYLVISVSGAFPERFLNLCALEKIYLWGAERNEDEIKVRCTLSAFRKMRRAAKKSHCKIKIVKKAGPVFKARRVFSRRYLVVGAAVFFLALAVLNCFVWTVRVEGNENMTDEEIKFVAEYCGLKQGVVKYKVNKRKFQENALRYEPRLAWIYPEIRGTVAYVHVREKTVAGGVEDVKRACNVVAGKSGRINSLTVKRGTAAVSVGQTVAEGQILITGQNDDGAYLHAAGEVLASRWIREEGAAKAVKTVKSYTGREKTKYSVNILGFGMGLYFSGKAPYATYELKESEKRLRLFGDVLLPITVKSQSFKELSIDEEKISEEEALENEKQRLFRLAAEKVPEGAKIIERTDEIKKENGQDLVAVIVEYEESIGLTDYIFTEE